MIAYLKPQHIGIAMMLALFIALPASGATGTTSSITATGATSTISATGTTSTTVEETRVDLNKGVWIKGPNLPSARQDAAVAVMGGRIYLIGGFGPHDEQMSSVLVFEPTFPSEEARPTEGGPIISHPGEWHYAATMPEPVDHATAAALDGYIYVAGGRIENLVTNKFWRYDPVDDRWEELPSMPIPRYGPVMQAVNGKLYLFAGQSSHGNDETSILIFDPQTNEWATRPYGVADSRWLAASAVIDGRIFFAGGRGREGFNYRSCDIYDPLRDRWATCSNMREGRSDFGLATVNNRLMAIGGENPLNDTNTQTTEISSTDGSGWMNGPWMPYPRHGMAVVSLGNQIWVIGGSPYIGTAPTESVIRYVSPVVKVKFRGRKPS